MHHVDPFPVHLFLPVQIKTANDKAADEAWEGQDKIAEVLPG